MNKVEFNDHPIRSTLTGFLDLQKAKEFIERGQLLNDTQSSQRNYVLAVVRQVRLLLDSADVNLVSQSGLGGLNDQLNRAFYELSLFQSNGDPTHIQNALSHAEDAARSIIWVLPSKAGIKGRNANDEIAAISAAANAALAQVSANASSIAARANEFNNQIIDLETRMTEMRNEINASVAAANASLITVQAQNIAQETTFNQKFSDLSHSLQTTFDMIKDKKEKIDDFYICKLKDSEESARRIV